MEFSKPLIDLIAGTRPNFIKIAPIVRQLQVNHGVGKGLRYRLIHTGQHYDQRMSGSFFEQLGIPVPDINLDVGSGSQAEQTGSIMVGYERVLMKQRADVCLVVGDVNSTMACAIAARKLGVRVAHVEAGIRSGDWSMPEEINRVVTDAISDYFFTTSEGASANLVRTGVATEKIYFVGNVMIDTLLANAHRLRAPPIWTELRLQPRGYVVMTLHRPANVDDLIALAAYVQHVCDNMRGMIVVFPVHPRTARMLERLPALPRNLCPTEPQPYLEFIYLIKNAKAVITDSGGITEETTVLDVPCITLRDSTERPETVEQGTNVLAGTDPSALPLILDDLFAGRWKRGQIPAKWDGRTSERIVRTLEQVFTRS